MLLNPLLTLESSPFLSVFDRQDVGSVVEESNNNRNKKTIATPSAAAGLDWAPSNRCHYFVIESASSVSTISQMVSN